MTTPRPAQVGLYQVLQDYAGPTASVRVFKLKAGADAVGLHVHKKSAQIYVALEGMVVVDVGGQETALKPFDVLQVPAGAAHGASPAGGDAVLMNISVPPLEADDQVPVSRG